MASNTDLRICTLLPSATEIAYFLGLGANVVGITHECDYPADVAHKQRVVHSKVDAAADSGGIDAQVRSLLETGQSVYELDITAMSESAPNLVITQGLCEVCALPFDDVADATKQLDSPPEIVSLNPVCLEDVFDDIVRVGTAAGVAEVAHEKVADMRRRVDAVQRRVDRLPIPNVVCLEWLDPLMIGGHWLPDMVALAGGKDVMGNPGEPARRVTITEVVAADPDVMLLMPCGYDVAETVSESETSPALAELHASTAYRNGEVYALNANAYSSRSGPRLVDGVELLAALLHPDLGGHYAPDSAVRLNLQP